MNKQQQFTITWQTNIYADDLADAIEHAAGLLNDPNKTETLIRFDYYGESKLIDVSNGQVVRDRPNAFRGINNVNQLAKD